MVNIAKEAQLDKLRMNLHFHSKGLLSEDSIWAASCLLVDAHSSVEHSLQLKRKQIHLFGTRIMSYCQSDSTSLCGCFPPDAFPKISIHTHR